MNHAIVDELSKHAELRIGNIGYACHEADWSERKQHSDYDIWLVTGGEVALELDGGRHTAREGDIVFFNPGVPYAAYGSGGPCSHIFIHFDVRLGERSGFLHGLELMGIVARRHVQREGELLRAAFDAYLGKQPMAHLTLQGYFTALLAKLIALPAACRIGSRPGATRSRQFARLMPVLEYMEAHVGGQVTAGRLAELAGMSPKYFHAFFKAHIGLTPQAYMTRIKMNRARELLIERKLSVKEIAYQLGYADPYTFSKAFKRLLRCPPSQFNEHT